MSNACYLASQRRGAGIYNIGAEKFGTMRELLEALIEHARTESKIREVPFHLAVMAMRLTGMLHMTPFAPYHWLMYGRELYFDVSKAKNELHWTSRYSNDEMICESYDCYLRNFEKFSSLAEGSPHQRPVNQGILNLIKKII